MNELFSDLAPDEQEIFVEEVDECLQLMEASLLSFEKSQIARVGNS